MNRLIIVLLLFCHEVLGGNIVLKLNTDSTDTYLMDSLLSCVEKYVSYEYDIDTNRTNFCILKISSGDNGERVFYFSIYDGLDKYDFVDFDLNSLLAYRYHNTLVIIDNKDTLYKLQKDADSIEIYLNHYSEVYLETVFIETKNSCKLFSYNNMKIISNPSESRWFSVENDTCFSFGKREIWPYEKDTSIVYLNNEESLRLYKRKGIR